MCGIVAYVGHREACPIIIKGLRRLEYRGYDSAGIALMNGDLNVYKKKGKVSELEAFIADKNVHGNIGMGHTRWATHGEPNDVNAHPHYSTSGKIAIIHNGIIENYEALKTLLKEKGHTFQSDTDSEVFINLIEEIRSTTKCSLVEAVRLALHEVVGAYAIVVLSKDDPNQLI
ncbi:MAG TPA: class II glutamine amidotransferase, partial [Pontibacter sp.]